MLKRVLLIFLVGGLVAGCADTKPKAPQEGRIAIYETTGELEPNAKVPVKLEKAAEIKAWVQSNYNAQNRRPTGPEMGSKIKLRCTVAIDSGFTGDSWAVAEPLYKDGVIYAMSSGFSITAIRVDKCKRLWTRKLPIVGDGTTTKAMGLAIADNTLFATVGDGSLFALTLDGTILGQKKFDSPVRSAPIVHNSKLYVTSSDNQIFVVRLKDGKKSWNYKTLHSSMSFFGMAPAGAYGDMLVVPFSNGDVTAFDANTGTVVWDETFLKPSISNRTVELSHILAAPVIEDHVVYIVTNAEETAAFNISTGRKLWEVPISGQSTPTISGNTLFIASSDEHAVALDKRTGQVIWMTPLPGKAKEQSIWHGPLVMGNKLIFTSSRGKGIVLDALTGEQVSTFKSKPSMSAPIAIPGGFALLVNRSQLLIYR